MGNSLTKNWNEEHKSKKQNKNVINQEIRG
jgi:hypothetical protein